MSKQRANIKDVARESGVSLTTVSLVLNGNDQRISDATRTRVREAINKLGYTPSRLARGLPNRRANTLAILLPALHNAFADVYFGELISGIYEVAAERGFRIMLEVARRSYVEKKEYLRLLDDCSVDGILFLGSTEEHTWLSDFHESDRPLVVVNNHFQRWNLHHVMCDYQQAGQLAADALVERGHQRIGHVSGPGTMVRSVAELTEAFVSRLDEHGVRISDSMIISGEFQTDTSALACDELLARDPKLTAIFCANDKSAMGVYQSLRRARRTVGGDISVIGCDDIPLARLAQPALTTVGLNFAEVGRRSCENLLMLLRRRGEQPGRINERIPVSLIERESLHTVGEPKAAARVTA
jgi:LacI family transcriptional regulator